MGEIRTDLKRSLLRSIFRQAQKERKSLYQVMDEVSEGCEAALRAGSFLAATGEAGGNASFQPFRDLPPEMAVVRAEELMTFMENSATRIGVNLKNPAEGDDAALMVAMMAALVPVRRFKNDYTGLRYGAGYYLGV